MSITAASKDKSLIFLRHPGTGDKMLRCSDAETETETETKAAEVAATR